MDVTSPYLNRNKPGSFRPDGCKAWPTNHSGPRLRLIIPPTVSLRQALLSILIVRLFLKRKICREPFSQEADEALLRILYVSTDDARPCRSQAFRLGGNRRYLE